MKKKRSPLKKHTRRQPRVAITHRQQQLPAGFTADRRRYASLTELVSPGVATVDGPQLTDDLRIRLTVRRLRMQRDFRFGSLTYGVIDKKRAIKEVTALTPLGRTLIEIEERAIQMVKEEVLRRRNKKTASAKRGR